METASDSNLKNVIIETENAIRQLDNKNLLDILQQEM
jgi:hypothetical protein